jgi:serine/threonine protein kinase
VDRTRTANPAGSDAAVPAVARDATTAQTAAPGSATAAAASPGSLIRGRYRLEQLLGAGAMGQVWKAKDLLLEEARDPRPHVAIKLLTHDMQRRQDANVALQREARKASSLAHPNIATVYTFDVDPGTGQAFIAMELLDGMPLDVLIRAEPGGIARERALGIVRGLAAGLAYAHQRGIVHCDFKPGNAFATLEGAAKILDFGIARLASEAERAADTFDAGRLLALTPRYATREMAQGGEPHPADDVYALGLVAYELLSGQHPYGGLPAGDAVARGLRPAPIKDLGRRRWRAIDRALELDRARRWPHAQAFLDAFDGARSWIPALAALAAAFAIAAGYSSWVGYSQSQPDVPFASLPAEVQAQFSAAMGLGDYALQAGTGSLDGSEALALLFDAVSQFSEAYSLHPRNPDAKAALDRALAAFGAQLKGATPEVRADARAGLQSLLERHPELEQLAALADLVDDLG